MDKTRQKLWVQAAGNEDLLGLTTLSDEQMMRYGVAGNVHFFNGGEPTKVPVDEQIPLSLPLQSSVPIPEPPEQPVSLGKKRSRAELQETPEEIEDVETSSKTPHLEIPQPATPRRSLESFGARERDGSPGKRMSVEKVAAMSGVHHLVPESRRIARTALQYRQMAKSYRSKLVIAKRSNKNLRKLAKRKFLDMVEEFTLSSAAKVIVKGELKNLKKKSKGHRWTLQDKLLWLAVYKRSPAVYRFLCLHLCLPSESTLKSLLKQVDLQPGISEPFMKLLKKKVQVMRENDKHVVLLFDEIFLRGRLFLNHTKDIVEGFENFGQRGRTNLVADHALVFMIQGIHNKWTQPVAFYFVSKTCPSSMLKLLIQDVVRAVTSLGLNVLGTVSDQGPTNRGAISDLRRDCGDSLLYKIDGKILVHLWDVPHILKNIRNNLLASDLEFGPGKLARWRHLINFYHLDESLLNMSSLTLKHLNPQGRDKMRVSFAAQVLSASVAKFMRALYKCSDGKKLTDCMDFADLCDDVDRFFDLCNGPRTLKTSEKSKPNQRANVTADSFHHTEWPKMYTSLQKWTFIRKNIAKTRHVPFCVIGWMENLKSYKVLCKKIFNDSKPLLKVLKLRNLNQDALENLFCLVRQCCGSSTDLTCSQFVGAVKTCLISRFSKLVTSNKNCLEDGAFFLNDLSECLVSSQNNSGVPEPPMQESLVRGDTPANFSRHVRSSVNNPVHRQGPTRLWASILPSLCASIKCDHCLRLLTTSNRSIDTLFCNLTSSFDLYPSSKLVSLFVNLQNIFESCWKKLLHRSNVHAVVKEFCAKSVPWGSVFCPSYQDSNGWDQILNKVVTQLINLKCQNINQHIKDGVNRRTRQALSYTNNHGLYHYEEESELCSHDLQLLSGAQAQDPAAPTLEVITSIPSTPTGKPATPFKMSTPHQGSTPQVSQLSGTPQLPQQRIPPVPLTPRQEARVKVRAAWQEGTPTTSRAEQVTPKQIITNIPQSDNDQQAHDDSSVLQLISLNKLHTLTVPVLKEILRRRGEKLSGNKPELMKRIINSFH
ncbi:DNA transposase [Frankliniella fusca]|uniref:DNA transposase n=1 Tax=Frankliniella fusca TaxID=407009 RepID=A0AAE1I526_9NEOP|nr:DNA transposase [Frankliniella fusca]